MKSLTIGSGASMMEAVLVLKPPHSWISSIVNKYPATIRILDCRALPGKDGVHELFEIICQPDQQDQIVKDLQSSDYVYDVDVIRGKEGRLIGSVKTHKCTACRSFATGNCFLVSSGTRPDALIEWTVLGADISLRELVKRLENDKVHVEIARLSRLEDQNLLTARQEQILQIALEKGYFDFPKGITLRELAKLLDISAAALTEILRRGQKRVLTEHFRGRISTISKQNRLA